jgi:hypothetical protein
MAEFFDDPPRLGVRLGSADEWFRGKGPRWLASLHGSSPFDVHALGDAHRRYALFSIQRAITSGTATVAVMDEPERALHRQAEARVLRGLNRLADVVIVATHSPIALDSGAGLLHARRKSDGLLDLSERLPAESIRSLAGRLGVAVSDIAAMWKVVLLVEGTHDKIVIEAFCPEIASQLGVRIQCLQGTHGLSHIAEGRLLFDVTDAIFLVVADNAESAWLSHLITGLRSRKEPRQQHGFLESERKGHGSSEERQLVELLSGAIDSGRLDRFDVFGFKERDIVRYLPVDRVDPSATSWDALTRQFLRETNRTRFGKGDGAAFKQWVNTRTNRGYATPNIRGTAREVAVEWERGGGLAKNRPPEFSNLVEKVRRILRGAVRPSVDV